MNNCFDLLNSWQKITKVPSKQCINRNNVAEIQSNIQLYWSKTYISILKDGNKSIFESKRRMDFFSIMSALENVVAIFEKWSTSETISLKYLLTYKLSQDHIELFFSAIRSRNDKQTNDTITNRPPNSLSSVFKLLVYAQIKDSDNANCLLQDSTCLLQTPKVVLDKPAPKTYNNNIVDMHKINKTVKVSSSTSLDHNPIVYPRYIWMLIKHTLITLSHT